MDQSVKSFFDQVFETIRAEAAVMHETVRADIEKLHSRFEQSREHVRAELDELRTAQSLILRILHHVLTQGPTMDHAALIELARQVDAVADDKINGAVSRYEDFAAHHTAVKDAMDDVGDVLNGLKGKLDKLDTIKATVDAPAQDTLPGGGSDSINPNEGNDLIASGETHQTF